MDIPLNLVAQCLTGFCVIYFRDINHEPSSPPHYYVTVPINDDLSLLLCIITSQIDNRAWFYHKTNDEALQCLVRVNSKDLTFLKKESVIDCNQANLIHKNELSKMVDPKHKLQIIAKNIPIEIQEKILKAISDSPLVKPFVKKILLPL